jgi:hypothetical protein
MLRASLRQIIVAVLPALATMVGVAAAETRPANLVIRIYDSTSADAASRAAAIEAAAAVIAGAGIRAAWSDCTSESQPPVCTPSRRGRELIIRIMPTLAPGSSVMGGSLETRSNAGTVRLILGSAVIDPATGVGVLATIFMDRVEAIAHRIDVPPSAVLGAAIAHEVGHLLLGMPTHGRSGLMREVWTEEELALGREEDWLFTSSERHILQTLRP